MISRSRLDQTPFKTRHLERASQWLPEFFSSTTCLTMSDEGASKAFHHQIGLASRPLRQGSPQIAARLHLAVLGIQVGMERGGHRVNAAGGHAKGPPWKKQKRGDTQGQHHPEPQYGDPGEQASTLVTCRTLRCMIAQRQGCQKTMTMRLPASPRPRFGCGVALLAKTGLAGPRSMPGSQDRGEERGVQRTQWQWCKPITMLPYEAAAATTAWCPWNSLRH